VEIVFENPDLMPHNLVIAAPGSLEELGLLAESTAQSPGMAERHYVPLSRKVLASTPLLQSGQSHRLSYVAPKVAGVYPYVCTYPGHWRRMFGALYVVNDLEAYETDPEKYLASRPLKIVDELLKNRRPRVEWKLEDLEADVGQLASGRSFDVGRQMFQVASCTSCHRLSGVGQVFGPDLTKLDPPRSRQELLRDMLDPSARIDDKYRSQNFLTDEGKTITGMVVEETDAVVRVIENPLLAADVVALPKSHITERARAAASIMPKGLLDRLSREEILDLIAYVHARGDRQNEVFRAAKEHEHHGR
jgi:putative heme-binding domain-containing protein